MSEAAENDDKTELPTEKRLREAVEQGRLPVSREAPLFGALAAMLVVCTLVLRDGAAQLAAVLSRLIDDPGSISLRGGSDAVALAGTLGGAAAQFLVPIVVLMTAAGLAMSFAQNLPRVVLRRIAPDWSKLSPASGLKRLFGRDGLVEFGKALFKLVAVGGIVALVLGTQRASVLDAVYAEPGAIPDAALQIFTRLLMGVCAAFAVLAGADLVWSRTSWFRRMMMSRREVKDEMRQAEGDPLLKARRRSLALDRSRRRMLRDVGRATMVIANPTHYAIALRYVRTETAAPMVVAKGQDLVALRIRELAEASNIAVVEDKLLARSMYDHVEVSKPIPPEFYKAVAEIVHFIQARNKKTPVEPSKVLR